MICGLHMNEFEEKSLSYGTLDSCLVKVFLA